MNEASQVFPYFIGTWVVLGLGSFALFHLNKEVALKRKMWPVVVIGSGILFIISGWLMGFRGEAMYMMVPATILITVLNLKAAQFCDSCGKTLYNQNPFAKLAFCPKCGSKLL